MKYFYSYRKFKCELLGSSSFHFPLLSRLIPEDTVLERQSALKINSTPVLPADLWERITSFYPLSIMFPIDNKVTYGKKPQFLHR